LAHSNAVSDSQGNVQSGSDCGFFSTCGWSDAVDAGINFVKEHKVVIATTITEVVAGGTCLSAAGGAGLVTGGAGFATAAGCGAVASAAGNAVGNALDDNADHSVSGQLTNQAEAAIWGAAAGAVGFGLGNAAKLLGKCHSFLPGTKVLQADGTRKAIQDVEVGDTVTSVL
jgi:hypothetical protein